MEDESPNVHLKHVAFEKNFEWVQVGNSAIGTWVFLSRSTAVNTALTGFTKSMHCQPFKALWIKSSVRGRKMNSGRLQSSLQRCVAVSSFTHRTAPLRHVGWALFSANLSCSCSQGLARRSATFTSGWTEVKGSGLGSFLPAASGKHSLLSWQLL